jgi:hypothetical protein
MRILLFTVPTAYTRESAASRAAASHFIAGLNACRTERFLLELHRSAVSRPEPVTMESLPPEKRARLLDRLHKRRAGR